MKDKIISRAKFQKAIDRAHKEYVMELKKRIDKGWTLDFIDRAILEKG